MNGTIIDSKKNYLDGGRPEYIVIKGTTNGTFTGRVAVSEKDFREFDYEVNDFAGYRFAEMKCDIYNQQARVAKYRERMNGAKNMYNAILARYGQDETFEINFIERQMKLAVRDYDREREKLKRMRKNFNQHIADYQMSYLLLRKKHAEKK